MSAAFDPNLFQEPDEQPMLKEEVDMWNRMLAEDEANGGKMSEFVNGFSSLMKDMNATPSFARQVLETLDESVPLPKEESKPDDG